jgi:hypothetical protein
MARANRGRFESAGYFPRGSFSRNKNNDDSPCYLALSFFVGLHYTAKSLSPALTHLLMVVLWILAGPPTARGKCCPRTANQSLQPRAAS